jgi:hypothetical protein
MASCAATAKGSQEAKVCSIHLIFDNSVTSHVEPCNFRYESISRRGGRLEAYRLHYN